LSFSILPPYGKFPISEVDVASPPATELIGALPKMISPPQSPALGVATFDVNTIGLEADPEALIVAPCCTAIYTSDPAFALTTTPSLIVNVLPVGTIRAEDNV